MNPDEKAVIIFCRYPFPGKVKTRLAKITGEKFAAEFYRLCAENTFNECRKLIPGFAKGYIFYSDEDEELPVKNWVDGTFLFYIQEGRDLGERMYGALKTAFNNYAGKAILIGTDIPDISAGIISDAFKKLDYSDNVIGPSCDGGFYLFGTKKPKDGIFDGINWSGNTVYADILGRFENENNIENLITLIDIDTAEDIKIWLKNPDQGNTGLKKAVRDLLSGSGIKLP